MSLPVVLLPQHLVPHDGRGECTLVLFLNRHACLSVHKHTHTRAHMYVHIHRESTLIYPTGSRQFGESCSFPVGISLCILCAALSLSLSLSLFLSPRLPLSLAFSLSRRLSASLPLRLLVHFSEALSPWHFDQRCVAKAYIWRKSETSVFFFIFLYLLKFKRALLAWPYVRCCQSMLYKVFSVSIVTQNMCFFLFLSLCWLKCVRLYFPPSHYHPLSRWIQRVISVSAWVCVGESEREREREREREPVLFLAGWGSLGSLAYGKSALGRSWTEAFLYAVLLKHTQTDTQTCFCHSGGHCVDFLETYSNHKRYMQNLTLTLTRTQTLPSNLMVYLVWAGPTTWAIEEHMHTHTHQSD